MLHRPAPRAVAPSPVDAGGFLRLVVPGLGWLLGVALHLRQPALGPGWWAVAAALGGLGLACRFARVVPPSHGPAPAPGPARSSAIARARVLVPLLAAGVLMGFGVSGWRAGLRLADALPEALVGQDLVLSGVVATLPARSANGLRFLFEVAHAEHDGRAVRVPRLVSLGWYRGPHDADTSGGPQSGLRAGQAWRLGVRLRQPHGNLNPHGFDQELHLFEQGVRATGSVRGAPGLPELLDAEAAHPLERWRQRVRDGIDAEVGDRRAAGVLAALSVGDQSAIAHADWQLFRDTGVSHLMSISGLHVTMFAWLASSVLHWLWCRSRHASLWLPAPRAAAVGGLLAAVGYALFSGWGVPAQRTVWMLGTVTLLALSGRRWAWPAVLLAAAVVVSVFDPWALLQPGFWLSFCAVALLMASAPAMAPLVDAPAATGRRRWGLAVARALGRGLRTQWVASIGLAPLTLVFFQQLSVVGFLANLVAIPLVTLLLTPLALLGSLWAPLWGAGAWVGRQLVRGLSPLAAVPWAVWPVAAAPWWAQSAGLLAAALAVMPLPWQLRLLGVPLVLPLLWPPLDPPPAGRFEVLAVDVGQGAAVLVRTRAHLLVYDTGPRYPGDGDAGERVLLPLLRARGESRIDRLVLSQSDADHVGGAESLLRGVPVDELISPFEAGHPLLALAPKATRCEAGQSWLWDGVRFEVLHPFPGARAGARKASARSCVLRVSGAQGSLLLAGDIEREQESRLVDSGASLRSEVLLVPRHGAKASSGAAFLDAVQPRVAVVQAGYGNRFGYPAAEVRARLASRGVLLRASPSCGAWHWSGAEGAAQEGLCERDRVGRYWHHAP